MVHSVIIFWFFPTDYQSKNNTLIYIESGFVWHRCFEKTEFLNGKMDRKYFVSYCWAVDSPTITGLCSSYTGLSNTFTDNSEERSVLSMYIWSCYYVDIFLFCCVVIVYFWYDDISFKLKRRRIKSINNLVNRVFLRWYDFLLHAICLVMIFASFHNFFPRTMDKWVL
jgi:hypothetical protein